MIMQRHWKHFGSGEAMAVNTYVSIQQIGGSGGMPPKENIRCSKVAY